ncbi:MAG TPA: AMP-binding protein [Thermodesulfovibrionales bacterium]|nr:AMP-binding protein [Thermodesulfovibrionales bacterium]
MINITPLEAWIREKAQIDHDLTGKPFVEALQEYQLQKVNEVIDYARRNSPFYSRHLASLPVTPLSALSDIAQIPFTTASDLKNDPFSFLAVPQGDVARIVTLRTSGSTGEAKRLFFTEGDLELTVDFYHHGMSTLVRPGQRVAVFFPGETSYSIGDLLLRGLQRMDVRTFVYGLVKNPNHAAEAVASFGPHCIVGIPTQVLAVACSPAGTAIGKGTIESVLLSADYVPQPLAKTLEEIWGCRVFAHYAMTEMCHGGGIECEALAGYHLREADLYFEVVDHETGVAYHDGEIGEVVFTTLTRQGMPLIRYRTGDIARMITRPCSCGSILKRMDYVRGRWNGLVRLDTDCTLTVYEMDETLFQLPGLLDYRATVSNVMDGRFRLHIDMHSAEEGNPTDREVLQCLNKVEAIRKAVARGILEAPTVRFSAEGLWTPSSALKRKIMTT